LPRLVLLVSAQQTLPVVGCTAIHSGRSILVAPARSAAPRALTTTSAWEAKPAAGVEAVAPVHQLHPLPAAVGLEAGDVEGAVLEELRD
jgi:hypothetical protein